MPGSDALLNAFVTLLVTIDPPGLAPIFIGLTAGMTAAQRRDVAIRATAVSFGVLLMFALFGQPVLGALGITMAAFRVAGGLLLFWIAFEMIFERRQERHAKTSEIAITQDHVVNVAIFPLAVPLTAGPGAISATVLLSAELGTSAMGLLALLGILAGVLALVLMAFALSGLIDRWLGVTGRSVLTRILGVVLAALSVQFVADGALALARAGT